ncbi:hypothetical protein BDK51DRAFT_37581 [Blyttiomyces helicus]|uniref:Amine oxidase n=1 Tax=Blyttiomyces helicus TaxID=388810 RepID=A0A4P9VYP6_9FUNG|nr:hypothetical protein BDK51DRAFT_37581 [Blyttiomyces helicus]|eukprot:RKO84392.1 hypothetical protein BDK51DRAFT_37581 [Blyttiomyces helicus]
MSVLDVDLAIVGAGLSGLTAALRFAHARVTEVPLRIAVIEAKDAIGGRTLSTSNGIDLGGAWLWPHDSRALALAADLHVETLPQPGGSDGEARVQGGMSRLVAAVEHAIRALPHVQLRVCLSTVAESVKIDNAGVVVTADNLVLRAQHVLVALPPRLAAHSLSLPIDEGRREAMLRQPIWMGAMGKVGVEFAKPWWRSSPRFNINTAFLPGSAIKQMLDASSDTAYAIVAFVVPPDDAGAMPALVDSVVRDLGALQRRVSGSEDAAIAVVSHSWRHDPFVFAPGPGSPFEHPRDGRDALRAPLRDECGRARVFFAGSETDGFAPGYLDGAVRAGERAAVEIGLELNAAAATVSD